MLSIGYNPKYYFAKNLQQDVIGILDSNNNLIVKYEYDSFGNILSIKDANNQLITDTNNIGIINPFRYRGYYYDKETDLYYLNSRYYDPKFGRFLNADSIINFDSHIHSQNLFCYTNNNFVNLVDYDGCLAMAPAIPIIVPALPIIIPPLLKTTKKAVESIAKLTLKGIDIATSWIDALVNSKYLDDKLDFDKKVYSRAYVSNETQTVKVCNTKLSLSEINTVDKIEVKQQMIAEGCLNSVYDTRIIGYYTKNSYDAQLLAAKFSSREHIVKKEEISFSRKLRVVGSPNHYHDGGRKIHIWYGENKFSKNEKK